MTDTIIGAFIGVGGAIVGTLIGAWIGYRFTISINQITDHNKAVARFRVAFIPEIIFFKYDAVLPKIIKQTDTVNGILSTAYLYRNLKAYEVFRGYLSTKDRRNIEKAWKDYQYGNNDKSFEQYSIIQLEQSKDIAKQVALEKINKILDFAKFK